jgi:putative flippase GtrA
MISRFEANPRQLFLVDGIGALISSFMLAIVLVKLESIFGIPSLVLYFLASFPILFALFDIYCYVQLNNSSVHYLKIISLLNLSYCCLSIGLALFHFEVITGLGLAYLALEILIVFALAFIEWEVANRLSKKNGLL